MYCSAVARSGQEVLGAFCRGEFAGAGGAEVAEEEAQGFVVLELALEGDVLGKVFRTLNGQADLAGVAVGDEPFGLGGDHEWSILSLGWFIKSCGGGRR